MNAIEVEAHPVSGNSMLEEIRRNAELRLREIAPVLEEAERLRDVLSVIEQQSPRTESGVRSAAIARRAAASQVRAPKGSNKRMILELVGKQPGITAAEIAQSTGVKRTVVASTVSRLKRSGELEAHDSGGVQLTARRSVAA